MTQLVETIDNIPNDVLAHVIRNSNDFTWNFLAMKIILTRLNLKIIMNDSNSAYVLPECCDELRNLLKKSVNVPNSRTDLNQILSILNN